MEEVALLPIDQDSSREMAIYRFDIDVGITNPTEELLEVIIKQYDFVPFYIEKLIRRLALNDETITVERVNQEVLSILTDAKDSWKLEHFRNRLKDYYKGGILDTNDKTIKKSALAKSILNHCATEQIPQSINDCHKALKSSYSIDDRDIAIELLTNLVKDHYLQRDNNGRYSFCFSLVQRWWVLAEGLNTDREDSNA